MWTPARLKAFIISGLRAASSKYPPKYETLGEAFVGAKLNEKSGRIAKHYKCASCKNEFPGSEVEVDHITPVVDPSRGFTTWDEFITRLFCEKSGFQVLCKPCHQVKTNQEKEQSRAAKSKL